MPILRWLLLVLALVCFSMACRRPCSAVNCVWRPWSPGHPVPGRVAMQVSSEEHGQSFVRLHAGGHRVGDFQPRKSPVTDSVGMVAFQEQQAVPVTQTASEDAANHVSSLLLSARNFSKVL